MKKRAKDLSDDVNVSLVRWLSGKNAWKLTYEDARMVITPCDARRLVLALTKITTLDTPKILLRTLGKQNNRFLMYYIETDKGGSLDPHQYQDFYCGGYRHNHRFEFPTRKLCMEFLGEVGGMPINSSNNKYNVALFTY